MGRFGSASSPPRPSPRRPCCPTLATQPRASRRFEMAGARERRYMDGSVAADLDVVEHQLTHDRDLAVLLLPVGTGQITALRVEPDSELGAATSVDESQMYEAAIELGLEAGKIGRASCRERV